MCRCGWQREHRRGGAEAGRHGDVTSRRLPALTPLRSTAAARPVHPQDRIEENAATFLDWLQSDDCVFYFCGLKIMCTSRMAALGWSSPRPSCRRLPHVPRCRPCCRYTSVLEVLERMGAEAGVDVKARIAQLKQEHRWHVETA